MRILYYLVEQSFNLLWFLLTPLFGILISKYFSKDWIKAILVSCVILFSPIIIGYAYTLAYFNEVLFFIILSSIYALVSRNLTSLSKITITLTLSFGLIFLAGFATIIGEITIQNTWEFKNYKIEYIKDQGFSGGPLYTYKLSKYTKIPIFITEVERMEVKNNSSNCSIYFPKHRLTFNKCEANNNELRLIIEP